MVPAGNSELRTEARSARCLDKTPTAFEAAQLIKPPALRGVSDSAGPARQIELGARVVF